ncbi:hypothetical protein K501DRAFT_275455 [Backusella circina FSU 941]|nr:hypothetical protein K501DRAFT_275455 [Backusella circina FSU 941]
MVLRRSVLGSTRGIPANIATDRRKVSVHETTSTTSRTNGSSMTLVVLLDGITVTTTTVQTMMAHTELALLVVGVPTKGSDARTVAPETVLVPTNTTKVLRTVVRSIQKLTGKFLSRGRSSNYEEGSNQYQQRSDDGSSWLSTHESSS